MKPTWTRSETTARLRTLALSRFGASERLGDPDERAVERAVDRAAGLLAGRIGCQLVEAYGLIGRIAAEQGRDVRETAADLVETLDAAPAASPRGAILAAGIDVAPTDGRPDNGVPDGFPHGPDSRPDNGPHDLAERLGELAAALRSVYHGRTGHGEAAATGPALAALPANIEAVDLRDRLATATGAEAVIVMGVESDGSLRMMGAAGVPASVATRWQRVAPHVGTAATAAVTRGRAIWLPDLALARREYLLIGDRTPDVEPADRWPSRAWLPVRDGGRVVGVIGVLWPTGRPFDAAVKRSVTRAAASSGRRLRQLLATTRAGSDWSGWLASVQAVLDMLPGSAAVLSPVRAVDGGVVDYVVEAVSPEAVDMVGRRGRQLLGQRALVAYPGIGDTDLWAAFEHVLDDGEAREVGPFDYTEVIHGASVTSVFSVRVSRLGSGLLITWIRDDERQRQAERVARTERLGNLGWYERDLVTGRAEWSEQVYRIFGADPAGGPLSLERISDLVLPDDAPDWARAMSLLIEQGKPMDIMYRVQVGETVKHLRSFGEAIRDATGHPLRTYGMVQDVTAREEARERLTEVQRELAEHRRSLDAEHRLAIELQHIILPVPDAPVDLPGLRVAVRYLPAEQMARIGGDWYHATALPSGQTLLAIGDVAGHGLRAASTMAQLRHALAALASATTSPAELLRLLNLVLLDAGDGATATAVVARFDPAAQSLTWAQAGHPAPLMARSGVPAPLPRPPGLLLGAVRSSVYEEVTVPMTVGDLLLLYTDGLVERRGRSLDEGLAQVAQTVSEAIATAPDQPLARLLGLLRQANPDDDTCVVAARPLPGGGPADR
jgi:serine phosphatase RsbU (regulator of sigma subunit)